MREMSNIPDGQQNCSNNQAVVVKTEILDFDLPLETKYPSLVGDNVGNSSGSNIRSSLIGMGFSPSLVRRVIEEKGEDNFDVLLDTLVTYGEPDLFNEVHEDKRASLLMMNFSRHEIEFAFNKLGEAAPIEDVVDFILAAQKAEESEDEEDVKFAPGDEKNENLDATTNEALFDTMEKTLHLLEMGFSESEISIVIDNFGYTVPISELADSIFTGSRPPRVVDMNSAQNSDSSGIKMEDRIGNGQRVQSNDPVRSKKTRNPSSASTSGPRNRNREEIRKGKRPRGEYADNRPCVISGIPIPQPETLKPEFTGDAMSFLDLDSTWLEEEKDDEEDKHLDPRLPQNQLPRVIRSNPSVSKRPYFFYGSVVNLSPDSWTKISNFLRGGLLEFMNTRFFSALWRKEGYAHNLPTENRFEILPKAPMTIVAAMPHTKRWWPSWDTRKQLRHINSAVVGITHICDRVGQTLLDCRGQPSSEQKKYLLHQCLMLNLVWTGKFTVVPMEPEDLEHILGYPRHYTEDAASSLTDRLMSMQHCFQTDTLAYILSCLKSKFPAGITILSLMSGMGGVEVTLDRLGIHLKGVVSVESSEMNRRILRNWWQNSGQTGDLVQIEDMTKLNTRKLDELMEKFGSFDIVICQNPCSTSKDPRLLSFDFSMFYEVVRVLQRVRSAMG